MNNVSLQDEEKACLVLAIKAVDFPSSVVFSCNANALACIHLGHFTLLQLDLGAGKLI